MIFFKSLNVASNMFTFKCNLSEILPYCWQILFFPERLHQSYPVEENYYQAQAKSLSTSGKQLSTSQDFC